MNNTETEAHFDAAFPCVDDVQCLQATADATTHTKALETIFVDFAVHDATHLGEPMITVGGEIHAPVGMLPTTISRFLDWAVAAGLVVVTTEGEALRSHGLHELPLGKVAVGGSLWLA